MIAALIVLKLVAGLVLGSLLGSYLGKKMAHWQFNRSKEGREMKEALDSLERLSAMMTPPQGLQAPPDPANMLSKEEALKILNDSWREFENYPAQRLVDAFNDLDKEELLADCDWGYWEPRELVLIRLGNKIFDKIRRSIVNPIDFFAMPSEVKGKDWETPHRQAVVIDRHWRPTLEPLVDRLLKMKAFL